MDFENLDYLKNGNPRQQKVFNVLAENKVMVVLEDFFPILVGTFPIGIDIENSDLDIICFWKNRNEFISEVEKSFKNSEGFELRETILSGNETIIANFKINGFAVEIFGQNIPVREQNAYRHMVIENEILKIKGENFREAIIELKRKGFKTEPAFGQLLGFTNNPYEELLNHTVY